MRLAIVAAPPLALASIATLALALGLAPHRRSAPEDPRDAPDSSPWPGCGVVVPAPEPVTCSTAHALIVEGHMSGGASHVQLAGPIIYTDVATNLFGDFYLRVPVEGNVCDLLSLPTFYTFGDDVHYTITFE